MRKELFARSLVIFFLLLAVAIPLGGWWISKAASANTLELHARMPENGGWNIDTIQAQVGKPLHLHITSDDVVHGFSIGKSDQPTLEIQPGEYVDTTLTFDRPGKYTFYCDRWCGPNHWRMRGTIEVTGTGQPIPPDPQPLFLKLALDLDAAHDATILPSQLPSANAAGAFTSQIPADLATRTTYLTNSPQSMWKQLRAASALKSQSDADLWNTVAWIWHSQTTSEKITQGQKLYTTNCAACHGETGKGDGVMVRGLPAMTHGTMGHSLVRPPDFTDPTHLLGASPALLQGKIIRGGMGTGMPYWGPIFTENQMDALVSYLYTFALKDSSAAP